MGPAALAAIMGGVGLVKGATIDKKREQNEALLQAATTRYSPWTGMQGKDPRRADPVGQGIAGAAYGMQLGQNNEAFEADMALKRKAMESGKDPTVVIGAGYGNGGGSNFFNQQNGPTSADNLYNSNPWGLFGRNS